MKSYVYAGILILTATVIYIADILLREKTKIGKIMASILFILSLLVIPFVVGIQTPTIYPLGDEFNLDTDAVKMKSDNFSTIYYTTDEEPDTETWYRYVEPVKLKSLPITVRAKCKWLNLISSDIVTNTYALDHRASGSNADEASSEDKIASEFDINSYVSDKKTERYQSLPSGISAGWGDDGGGRSSYTIDEINKGILSNQIIFNTISKSTIGNEKNFVGARLYDGINRGKDNIWNGNLIEVQSGEEYTIRLYCHNNNPDGYDAVAEDVEVRFLIPGETGRTIVVNGLIKSTNASPATYWDSVVLTSDYPFHLEYVPDSGLFENNGIGADEGLQLDNKIGEGEWVRLGYSDLDGRIPGCYQYASYTTIRVKVVSDINFTVDQKVRLVDDTFDWQDFLDAQVGDEVEFQIAYKNTDNFSHSDVMIRDILPENMEYIPRTTKVYNSNYPNGLLMDQDTICDDGINIGAYAPNANAYIRFRARVRDKSIAPGSNTLVNWSQGWVDRTAFQDYSGVQIHKYDLEIKH